MNVLPAVINVLFYIEQVVSLSEKHCQIVAYRDNGVAKWQEEEP